MKKKLFSMLLLGACFLASMSLFTSCSEDYDDDIKSLKAENVTLRSELQTVKSSLEAQLLSEKSTFETQIAAVKAELQAAIDKKADEATVSNLKAKLQQLEIDYAAKIAVLTTQIETATEAIAKLDQKADKETVDAVMADLAALTGKLTDESKAREAVEANLRIQAEALEKLKKEITDANFQGQIDAILAEIGKFETTANTQQMKADMQSLQKMISSVNENMDALTVLIERMLNSISLVPKLFINGIEAIEFKSLVFNNFIRLAAKHTDGRGYMDYKVVNDINKAEDYGKGANFESTALIISNDLTEATYRLNPTTVQRDGIDESKIEMLAAKAEVRETRALGPMAESPVAFKAIKDLSNGLLTVTLQKTTTKSLNEDGNEITIVALKVPRNSEKYEAADIVSENSRLAEIYYTPRIAALNDVGDYIYNSSDKTYHGIWKNSDGCERPHHFWSFYNEEILTAKAPGDTKGAIVKGVYWTNVDANPSLEGVTKKILFTEKFDLTKIVTGCLLDGPYDTGEHIRQITKDELKQYGLEFVFDIPKDIVYNRNADNETDQQVFADVTPEGIISSRTPAGLTDNEAAVGKEPIVRVKLIDKNHNNRIVDARYFKIKWVRETPPPPPVNKRDSIHLTDKIDAGQMMDWCGTTAWEGGINWEWFVNYVYAMLKDRDLVTGGLSQARFKEIYSDRPYSLTVTPTTRKPIWFTTENEQGDALASSWNLSPEDIGQIFVNSENDTKTFIARFSFHVKDGVDPECKFPNIWFEWKITISQPNSNTIGKISGFYEQYWLEGEVGKKHDIMPVQFKTDYQENIAKNSYCLYHNNLLNAFVNPSNLVSPITKCGAWDLQFRYEQSMSGLKPNYVEGGLQQSPYNISKSKGQVLATKELVAWNKFGAYQLNRGVEMRWSMPNLEHLSWDYNLSPDSIIFFVDHDKSKNSLLNPLGDKDIKAADGKMVPERTHTRPIDLTAWVKLNSWNYVPVLNYQVFMVAPLRINMTDNLGIWYEGYVNGYKVDIKPGLSMTDFRGYLVADTPDNPQASDEQKRWSKSLWDYYEVKWLGPDLEGIRFAFKMQDGNLVVDESDNPNWMSKRDIYNNTKGNIAYSFGNAGEGDWMLTFYNNGGSNIEKPVRVKIPIAVEYGFGELKKDVYGWIYPRQ